MLTAYILASFPYNLEGTVSIDGNNMTNYVAENLEYKIKLSSPSTKLGGQKKKKIYMFIF